ncbi:MAG: PHP domain-containing protein [archaeon]
MKKEHYNKFDLHCHTTYSNDANITPKELVMQAKKVGLKGIALTDHETTKGWSEALKEGKKQGIIVIKGEERKVYFRKKKVGELIGLFLKKELKSCEVMEVIEEIHSQKGLVIVPHPFDYFRNDFKDFKMVHQEVNAIEALNARSFMTKFNDKAFAYAKKHKIAVVGGSDAHFKEEIGKAYTLTTAKNETELKKEILAKKTMAEGITTGLIPHLKTFLKRF